MATKIMICMVNNVQNNGRIYNKGDKREALKDELETELWHNQETEEKARQDLAEATIAAESIRSVKKLQEENVKLRMEVKAMKQTKKEDKKEDK